MNELNDLEVSSTIRDAYLLFSKVSQERTTTSNSKLVHPEYVACLLARFVEDEYIVAAAILQNILTYDGVEVQDIQNLFGNKITNLVLELTLLLKDDNIVNKKTQLVKYLNTISQEAFTIKMVNRLHETLSLINPLTPYDFVKWHLKDTSYIINNINRELDDINTKVVELLTFSVFYVELTKNI
jgi:(p)ppGpp synthase/HD superfamily hydrolase